MKAIILLCLIGYAMSQAAGVCLYDQHHFNPSNAAKARLLQALKKICPENKSMCCDAGKLTNLQKGWKIQHSNIEAFFVLIKETIEYVDQLFDEKDTKKFRKQNWKNDTTCKGKLTTPLVRRLQGKQVPCPQSKALVDAMANMRKSHAAWKAEGTKCMNAISAVRAGNACTVCDRIPANQVDMTKKHMFPHHATVEKMMHTECSKYLDALVDFNIVGNKIKALIPASRRRLQAAQIDFIGFPITSCSTHWTKKSRRLQAAKDSVQLHKECADLGLWMMNGFVMDNGPWSVNPKLVEVLKDVTNRIGTPDAKASFAKLTGSIEAHKRQLQAVKVQWKFAWNEKKEGAILTDHTPKNIPNLSD